VYEPARAHVLRIADDPVVGAHFAIQAIEPTDVNQDLVPLSRGGDRSRTEIKIAPSKQGMHVAFKAKEGDTYVYAWRFRISPAMKFASSFTHIHQIKAYGGDFSDPPLITFTPIANEKNANMEIRHVGDMQKNAAQSIVLGTVPLSNIVGQWLDVLEEITYSNSNGRYQLLIRDDQGRLQLKIDRNNLAMWRTGAEHMRPKWGIYRRHSASLNQNIADTVYFANFAITRGLTPTAENGKDASIDGRFESKSR
jgi:Polysaccharide lyase